MDTNVACGSALLDEIRAPASPIRSLFGARPYRLGANFGGCGDEEPGHTSNAGIKPKAIAAAIGFRLE